MDHNNQCRETPPPDKPTPKEDPPSWDYTPFPDGEYYETRTKY